MYLIQNQYSILYVVQYIHSEIFNIYNMRAYIIFLTTNKVGIVIGENFEVEEYMPKNINELLSLR